MITTTTMTTTAAQAQAISLPVDHQIAKLADTVSYLTGRIEELITQIHVLQEDVKRELQK